MTKACVTHLQYVAHAGPDLAVEWKFYGKTWGLTKVGDETRVVASAA